MSNYILVWSVESSAEAQFYPRASYKRIEHYQIPFGQQSDCSLKNSDHSELRDGAVGGERGNFFPPHYKGHTQHTNTKDRLTREKRKFIWL